MTVHGFVNGIMATGMAIVLHFQQNLEFEKIGHFLNGQNTTETPLNLHKIMFRIN